MQAEHLTRQMLSYSGRGNITLTAVNLNDVVGQMSGLLGTAVSKSVSLVCQFDQDIGSIKADATQIRQVAMNLIIYASDAYMGKPGDVRISTGVCQLSAADLSTFSVSDTMVPGAYVFVEVTDDGIGMSKETLDHMFDSFYAIKFDGSGLGLSAVMGIVQGHRGGVSVDSQPNVGTCIRVLFPEIAIEPVVDFKNDSAITATALGSGTILIIDDEHVMHDVADGILQENGYTTITARNGITSLEEFRRRRDEITLVLVDQNMPKMSGFSIAEQMAEQDTGVPILLMSGFDRSTTIDRFGDHTFAGFVQKPFQFESLLQQVALAISQENDSPAP